MDELKEGDNMSEKENNWKTTYPPRGIEEHLMEKGFFHKILPFVWIQESRTGR